MVDLWEIFLPRHQLLVTLMDHPDSRSTSVEGFDPFQEQSGFASNRGSGRPWGRITSLGFGEVPGNAMPKAPIQDLIDLHEAVNRMLQEVDPAERPAQEGEHLRRRGHTQAKTAAGQY